MRSKQRLLLFAFIALGSTFMMAAGYLIWRDRGAAPEIADAQMLAAGERPAGLRITVSESGLSTISAAALEQAHLDDVELALSLAGEPVPFFEEAGSIYFYAIRDRDTLNAPTVYWLAPGESEMMATRDAAATAAGSDNGVVHFRWEENEIFVAFAESEDAWFARRLFAPGPLSETEIPVTTIRSDGGGGDLRLRAWSNNADYVAPDHHLQVEINGTIVTDHSWDGKKLEIASGTIPAGTLKPEANTLLLRAPGDTGAAGDDLYVDWIELDYEAELVLAGNALDFSSDAAVVKVHGAQADALLLDITDVNAPVRLTGLTNDADAVRFAGATGRRRYVLLSPDQALQPTLTLAPHWEPLRAAKRGADYIAIVPPDSAFKEAVQPLLDFRSASGLKVETVPVFQIFDEFGGGQAAPEAIRDFLAYAGANWQPKPRFVLLVGDASYDTHDFGGGQNRNLIPTYHVFTDYAGYVASDTWLSMPIEGDLTPQIAIGRLPAQTPAQITLMVDKILAYEATTADGWQSRALLVADDEPQFDEVTLNLANDLDSVGFATEQLYMSENEDIRSDILAAINDGVGLINYVGHGSVQVWGDERVFQASDAASLANDDYPIFITFTCLNGYFNHPDVDALAESLLWQPGGGIVAAIAPSGRSLTSQQTQIGDVFFDILLNSDGATLGEALLTAKQSGSDNDYLYDVIHTFNLLGDPALRFQPPQP